MRKLLRKLWEYFFLYSDTAMPTLSSRGHQGCHNRRIPGSEGGRNG